MAITRVEATAPPPLSAGTSAVESRALSKVSWHLMPVLLLGLFISYVDRANLGVLFSPMSKDLGLTATAFGLAAGMFYIGYLFFEIPSNMALARFGARLWIARIMVTWGIVTVALSFVHSETSLYILRILLGVAEAGFFPGVLLYLTFWYPPKSIGRAYSIFEIGIPVSLALASALTSSLLAFDGVLGLAGWRWVFILQGIPAVLLGVYIFFVLPDSPQHARWLDAEEKAFLTKAATSEDHRAGSELRHVGSAFKSALVWLFSFIYFSMVIGFWSVTYFLPQILQESFKVDAVRAGFMAAIPWAFAAVAIYVIARSSARTGDRKWHMLGCLGAAGAGLWLSAATSSPVLALIGICFGAAGMQAAVPLFWSMPAAMFSAGTASVAIAMINSLGNTSGLAGPWVLGFFKDMTGSSQTGLYYMSFFFFLSAIMSFFMSRHVSRHGKTATDRAH